jgi:hypothetical protein
VAELRPFPLLELRFCGCGRIKVCDDALNLHAICIGCRRPAGICISPEGTCWRLSPQERSEWLEELIHAWKEHLDDHDPRFC